MANLFENTSTGGSSYTSFPVTGSVSVGQGVYLLSDGSVEGIQDKYVDLLSVSTLEADATELVSLYDPTTTETMLVRGTASNGVIVSSFSSSGVEGPKTTHHPRRAHFLHPVREHFLDQRQPDTV